MNELYLRDMIDNGYISEKFSEDGKLVLYNYTDRCVFKKKWNHLTLNSRGHVYQIKPRKLIARPFPKFYNLMELTPEKQKYLLKRKDYRCYEKLDGSLGIIYFYDGKWRVNTRGSFNSEQAQEALKILNEKYSLTDQHNYCKQLTLLVEIIYPENKIIINYKNKRQLVLLAAYSTYTGEEISRNLLYKISYTTKIPLVKEYDLTFDEMFEFQKSQDLSIEGYVVRFDDGYRVKMKSMKYLAIARCLSNLTPLSLWKTMKMGKVDQKSLEIIPEEFREDIERMVDYLEYCYCIKLLEINNEYFAVKYLSRREIAQNKELKHKGAIFAMIDNKMEKVDNYIMRKIRPRGDIK